MTTLYIKEINNGKMREIYNEFNREPYYLQHSPPDLKIVGWKNGTMDVLFMDYCVGELTIYNTINNLTKETREEVEKKLSKLGLLEQIIKAGIEIKKD